MVGSDSRFVVIADVHVLGEAGTEILQAAIRSINALSPAPDFVLVAGDFVECGAPREYELFTSALKGLRVPVRAVPGNHDLGNTDDLGRYARVFGDPCYSFEHKGHHCIGLNTCNNDPNPDNWHGKVETPALEWLKADLAKVDADKPILLFHHHGLVGPTQDLSCDVANAEEVLACFEGHKLVAAFGGHAHRLRLNCLGGRKFFLSPALSTTRKNSGGEPPGYLVVTVNSALVNASYEIVCMRACA